MTDVEIDPHDTREAWPIRRHTVLATGRVMGFVEDEVATPDGDSFVRQWATHPGAVAIIALDDQQRIAVVHQYRHPVAMKLIEPPAGLLDVDGEDPLAAARRELAEEALLAASDWRVLADIFSTPGGCQESIRIYLARDLREAPRPDGFVVEDEELHMDLGWVPLERLVDAVLAGDVQSPSLVSGTLALQTALATGRLDSLRPGDAPWPAREQFAERNRELAQLTD